MNNDKVVAKLTVYNADILPIHRRNQIVNWLRRQARMLERHNKDLAARYTAKFYGPQ